MYLSINWSINLTLILCLGSIPGRDLTWVFVMSRNLHTTHCKNINIAGKLLLSHGVSHREQQSGPPGKGSVEFLNVLYN